MEFNTHVQSANAIYKTPPVIYWSYEVVSFESDYEQHVSQTEINGEKRSNAGKIDHLSVIGNEICCLSLSTCPRMVSFYKMLVFLHFC